jgi:hypothetical protein
MASYYLVDKSNMGMDTHTAVRKVALRRALRMVGLHLRRTKYGYQVDKGRQFAVAFTRSFDKAACSAIQAFGFKIRKLRDK